MDRSGADLERLIARLEQSVLPEGAVLKSPDSVTDRVTGEPREVDVTIRMRVGSTDVLIIMECRKHARTQDVQWIEQLVKKRDDVNASKAIAISSSGFYAPALVKAKFYGVETRTVEGIDATVAKGWFSFRKVIAHRRFYRIADTRVGVVDVRKAPKGSRPGDTTVFAWGEPRRAGTIQDLWKLAETENNVWAGVPTHGGRVTRQVELRPGGKMKRLFVKWGGRNLEVARIDMDVEQWYEQEEIPLNRVYGYMNDEATLMESAEFLVRFRGAEEVWTIIRDMRTGKERYMRASLDPTIDLADDVVVTLGTRVLRRVDIPGA